MLTIDHKAKIRHRVLVEGKSQCQVAKETGHSRNIVKQMLQDSEIPRYRSKKPRTAPVLGSSYCISWGHSTPHFAL